MSKLIAVLTTLAALAVATTAEGRSDMTHERGVSWSCGEGYVCVFNCRGDQGWYDRGIEQCGANDIDGGHWGWWNFRGEWRNEIEAMINTRNRIALFARGLGGTGIRYCAEPNSSDKNFGNNPIGNNQAESFKLFHQPGNCAHFGY